MSAARIATARRIAVAFLVLASVSCADENTTQPVTPVLTTVNVTLASATIGVGQTVAATAAGVDQTGAAIALGPVLWLTSVPAVATVNDAGLVRAIAPGTVQIVATSGGKAGQQTLTVTAPPAIKVNEVESNGGTPGDWIELYNPTTAAADLTGWIVKDNDDTHSYALPANSTIAAGGYLVVEEAALGFGLGAADAARLFTPSGTVIDSYTWDAHAAITYGRCPNGTGTFAPTTASTKGAANACATAPTTAPWPGSDDVTTVDGVSVFGTNLSGLTYEGASGSAPAVLWAVRNGPGTLFRLIFNGTIWTPDPANGWVAGKALRYLDGTGNPDAEGVTFANTNSASGMYVATERNNDASTISKNTILRFDVSQPGTSLTATNAWDITPDLPVVGANLGIEALTWIPDAFLVSKNFFDETAGHVYVPAEYPGHGDGLFFAGVEGNGIIYVYALNHTNNTFKRVASFTSGFTGVMGLEYDRELNYLWATCDDGCGGKSNTLEIDTGVGVPTSGRFTITHLFDRPSSMPNLNNEGFAIAPQSECVSGRKPVFWADDGETSGHSIRRATLPCVRFP